MFTLSILVSLVMLFVATLHFYWAFGGSYGLRSAGPKLEGQRDFVPGPALIFVVAFLLLSLSVLSLLLVSPFEQIKGYVHYFGYAVSCVFVVRAVGDFKYVGLFKKVYNSHFAKMDTRYFSPVILGLGVAYGVLAYAGSV